jgi:hypothetical protein
MENDYNPISWSYPNAEQYFGITSADGKIDTIDESNELNFSKTYFGHFSNIWDTTPNSVTVQRNQPSTQYTYDENGNCTHVKNYTDNKLKDQSVFQYDSNNRVIYRAYDGRYKEYADNIIDNICTFVEKYKKVLDKYNKLLIKDKKKQEFQDKLLSVITQFIKGKSSK